jgi:hypothetical protein
MTDEQVARRRAVEALRSGVPSWDAVSELGSGQGEVEDRFSALLDAAEGGAAGGLLLGRRLRRGQEPRPDAPVRAGARARLRGQHGGREQGDPLHDPAKVLRAAVDTSTGPGRVSGVLADAVAVLDP